MNANHLGASLLQHYPDSEALRYFAQIALGKLQPCYVAGLRQLAERMEQHGRAAIGMGWQPRTEAELLMRGCP